jgi:hypothetical protein
MRRELKPLECEVEYKDLKVDLEQIATIVS